MTSAMASQASVPSPRPLPARGALHAQVAGEQLPGQVCFSKGTIVRPGCLAASHGVARGRAAL